MNSIFLTSSLFPKWKTVTSMKTCSALAICVGMNVIFNASANNIPAYSAGDNDELIATFNIPTSFDPDASLNTDADGFKPANLYSNEHYKGDISHTIFYDFSGNGPITYNYAKTDLTDAQGKSYYPLWLLGMDNIGGDITFTFNQTYIDQYGVNISRVVINGAQNRFSTSPISVNVNGVEKSLEYTPHSSNIPAGDDTLKSSTTLEFEFPKASPVSEVTVTVSGFGMGFSSIDFYVGEPQTVITPVETISFIGIDDTQIPLVLPYSDSPVTLLPFQVLIDGTPSDEAYNRVSSYTIYDDKEVKIDEVSVNSTGNTQYSFETEGRYYIGVTDIQTEVEARYILELFTKLDNLPILGASMIDGIITIEQYIIDDENNATKRDLTAVPLFDVPDDMELYCRVWHDDTFMSEPDNGNEKPEYTPGIILLDDEPAEIPEGFNRYDSQKGLNLEGGNTIDTIVRKNGVISPTQSVRYTTIPNVPTAVTTINAAGSIPAPAYHIDGRHANQSSKGLIIELTPDGHARKVIR